MSGFNLEAFMAHRFGGHGGAVGITYHGRDDDWVELALPYDARLIGDVDAVAERVQAHLDAGADHVCLQAIGGPRGASFETLMPQWRRIAEALL